MKTNLDIVLGLQYGDEGKGRITEYLTDKHNYDICARFNGGPNAGHTIIKNDVKYVTHSIPSGIINPDMICYIGPGCVINLEKLKTEIKDLELNGVKNIKNRLLISDRCHVITNENIIEDENHFNSLGTTKQGIGPCYSDKYKRIGKRIKDIEIDSDLKSMIYSKTLLDKVKLLEHLRNKEINILAEGAQSHFLDINSNDYPFVTSCHTTVGSALIGLELPHTMIRDVYGVFKPYVTKVGTGEFRHELKEIEKQLEDLIVEYGMEFGATTGRRRRIGWLDLQSLKEAININGVNKLAICKIDVLVALKCFEVFLSSNKSILFTNYKSLEIVEELENLLSQTINLVSLGPESASLLERK